MRRAAVPGAAALAALATLALALGGPAAAAPTPWQVELGGSVEHLDNGAPDWRQVDAALRHRFDEQRLGELTLRRAERYGRRDTELGLGAVWPVGEPFVLALRATTAGNAAFLPRHGGQVDAFWRAPQGWVLGLGLTRNLYDTPEAPATGSSLLRMGVERYVGDWRFGGGWTRARLDGGSYAHGWRAQVDRFIGDGARLGLAVGGGRELESAPQGVLSTRVEALALVGRLPLSEGWALVGEASHTRVSDFEQRIGGVVQSLPGGYRRNGVRLGVARDF